MVDPSTAAEAAETKATKERKPEKTRAQKDAHNASCRTYRLKTKRRREDLEAMVPELQAENKRMRAEIKRLKAKQGIEIESQELRRALEIGGAIVELLKQIPSAWKVDGKNFTSFDEAQTWFLSQTYDQGPNDTNNNTTASAVAGPSCVANHGLPNNPDNNPSSHDPAAALDNPSTSDLFTDHYLAAAGSSLIAGHESPVMFDAPNYHDTINNLSTHDPAADNESGFSTPSAAGASSGTNGTNITAFAASGPSFPNHGLPNNAPDNNSFSHDPAPAAGSPTASAVGFSVAYPELNSMFDAHDDLDINDPFIDHDLAAGSPTASVIGTSFAANPEVDFVSDELEKLDINDHFIDDLIKILAVEFSTSSAAGFSLIASHESSVMVDAPNNHDTINNLSTHDPATGFPSASAAGSSSYDIGSPFPRDPAADNKAGFPF